MIDEASFRKHQRLGSLWGRWGIFAIIVGCLLSLMLKTPLYILLSAPIYAGCMFRGMWHFDQV